MNHQDLIYFGHESRLKELFIKEITAAFPAVELNNADDIIKGYRQEVSIHSEESDQFNAWLIAHGWGESSLNINLLMMNEDSIKKLEGYVELAKQLYPNKFKK